MKKVYINGEACMGCWTCIVSCPNGVLTRDLDNKVVAKCDLCPGLQVPACVANCPNEALVLVEEEKENMPELAGSSIKR